MKFKCIGKETNESATPFIESILEPTDRGCSYEFVKETTRGCPVECVFQNGEICAGLLRDCYYIFDDSHI